MKDCGYIISGTLLLNYGHLRIVYTSTVDLEAEIERNKAKQRHARRL
jgi:hypothetical protein